MTRARSSSRSGPTTASAASCWPTGSTDLTRRVRWTTRTRVLYVRDYENGERHADPAQRVALRARGGRRQRPGRTDVRSTSKGGFEPGKIYNLVYEAEGARVVGAGLLAFRDIASFLRDASPLNPAPAASSKPTASASRRPAGCCALPLPRPQPRRGRAARPTTACTPHVAGGRRGEFNHRFAQPSVQHTPNFGHRFPSPTTRRVDPYSERGDGLLRRQRERRRRAEDRLHQHLGRVLARRRVPAARRPDRHARTSTPAPETRVYHFAGTQHSAGALPQTRPQRQRGHARPLRLQRRRLRAAAARRADQPRRLGHATASSRRRAPTRASRTARWSSQPVTLDALRTAARPGRRRTPAVPGASRELDLGPRRRPRHRPLPGEAGQALSDASSPPSTPTATRWRGIRLPDLTVPVATQHRLEPAPPRHRFAGADHLDDGLDELLPGHGGRARGRARPARLAGGALRRRQGGVSGLGASGCRAPRRSALRAGRGRADAAGQRVEPLGRSDGGQRLVVVA